MAAAAPAFLEALKTGLSYEDAGVRQTAINAIERVGMPSSTFLEALWIGLGDKNADVRQTALEAAKEAARHFILIFQYWCEQINKNREMAEKILEQWNSLIIIAYISDQVCLQVLKKDERTLVFRVFAGKACRDFTLISIQLQEYLPMLAQRILKHWKDNKAVLSEEELSKVLLMSKPLSARMRAGSTRVVDSSASFVRNRENPEEDLIAFRTQQPQKFKRP